ncbi:phosducin [Metarhizium album ARSEF 1941]|uniref:Phosducin n=1 Tax=Metarhizium album (strain ARSEF 1941) TaxID=1081103 RepID=A0A0B2WY29_METAS|nr:phosducin [Metarhizium album ARSEF 1941]KHO01187.1 phosducin [Metarhizium album ARSEF 1941]
MATTAAQDEYNSLVAKNTARESHRDDTELSSHDDSDLDLDEETVYHNAKMEAALRMPTGVSEIKLPPASFDSGRSTGVKGVIADARSFETARKTKWIDRAKAARRSIFGMAGISQNWAVKSESETDDDTLSGPGSDEETFLQQWRDSRRRELEDEASRAVRTRRTSPSVRVYGRLDQVDALGYLDAIEKVSRETKVVVFVYDHECDVSAAIESALAPLVKFHSTIHFVKVHYDDIEFDNAAVPALLAYHNQGDLFANLTGLIEMMPDEESFGTSSLQKLLERHQVL